MTEKEAAQILAIAKAANPQMQISDAAGTVKAWVWLLGDYPAQAVLDAVKHHLLTSPYFPKPADIQKGIKRGYYLNSDQDKLEGRQAKALKPPMRIVDITDEELENLCKFVGLGYEIE